LRAEGLFDEDRKRPIPALPKCIGLVTSPQGAAIRDFLQILQRRFANVHVRVYPAAVQGQGAAAEIAAGIEFFNRERAADVIVVTRGGGSLEDLWPFNEERVARAVAASEIAVISAVGHEVDFTICDFVADLRVPTPSAAAELVIGRKAELTDRISSLASRLRSTLLLLLATRRRRLERAAGSYVFREPQNMLRAHQQRVDELVTRMEHGLSNRTTALRGRIEALSGKLEALDPGKVLGRGYAILLEKSSGRAIKDASETRAGAELRGILSRGELDLSVLGVSLTTGRSMDDERN
jgi:exodeoxyribonuclease VII large subunit